MFKELPYADIVQLNAFKKGLPMDPKVWMYLVYLAVSIGLTVWVATTLSRNGLVFLRDVFADEKLAKAINQLLTMGFYLLNLGYVTVTMRSGRTIADAGAALETLSLKVGLVLLVLGVLHFCNVFFLGRYRRGRVRQQATPFRGLPMHPQMPPPGQMPGPMPGSMPGQMPPPARA
jgi:hypothetical protein